MSDVGESEPAPLKPNGPVLSEESMSPMQFTTSAAAKIASQPLPSYDPSVWGVLTAISSNARKRPQGINMLLTSIEHQIGRCVADKRFQIESTAISANHCKIYRKKVDEDAKSASIFLKDTSTNGTYLNWEKLTKVGPEVEVRHGDIISLAAPPQHGVAFAFVFREVVSNASTAGAFAKRKADEFAGENKRLKGIGIGAPEGPISLDDFRSLQRSNTELRKQLESQVITIDRLRSDNRLAVEHHENEKRELKESVAKPYLDQLKELHHIVEVKQKEVVEINKICAEQRYALEDLNERLTASVQSCTEANEIMNTQKASLAELKAQLDEERDQRREEREKAAVDLKAAVHKAQSDAQEELKQYSDAATRREREQQEVINKLQESERETCLLIENLRTKLEDTRKKLVVSENKNRQLDTQVCEEQSTSDSRKKRVEELEHEMKGLRKELESEKQAAREEAWAKVSALELEMNSAMQDLDFERRKLKAARERIMLRETQLRAFYSTTEEISVLFAKQQEQLKSMQRTLEDEENYDNTSVDFDLNVIGDTTGTEGRDDKVIRYRRNNTARAGSATTPQRSNGNQIGTSSEEVSVTEKHDCDIRSEQGPVMEGDGIGTEHVPETEGIDTEHVPETESPGMNGDENIDLNKIATMEGDTMQIDEEGHVQGNDEKVAMIFQQRHSQSNTIRTADLIASETIGSWACSTAPSVHGENGSPRSRDNEEGAAAPHDPIDRVAESQSTPSSETAATRRNRERQALSEMIGIVAPDLKEQFGNVDDSYDNERRKQASTSDSDTESCTNSEDNNKVEAAEGDSISDSETEGSDRVDNAMDEDGVDTEEDSVG
ncbi:myosin-9 isoform X3 [Rosa chinensis]|uniref:myosin-9 isoform X3 n=1 Tax=Rosa chinensis TaxID=74649 RepID=UPI000D08B416|nr:myosin-9 isoform X3 [Rosa chinensis]